MFKQDRSSGTDLCFVGFAPVSWRQFEAGCVSETIVGREEIEESDEFCGPTACESFGDERAG